MLPVNRLHNTAAPALHITIPSNTSKNDTGFIQQPFIHRHIAR